MQASTIANRASAHPLLRKESLVGAITIAGALLALGIELDWLISVEGGPRRVAGLCIALGLLAMLVPDSPVAVGSRITGFLAIAVGFPAMTLTFITETTPAAVERVAGVDAISTSVAASEAAFPTADTAVLIGSRDTAVVYAAGSLATSLGAPLLLTNDMSLRRDTVKELQRLGVKRAIVVGDDPSPHIDRRLEWLGIEATRAPGGRIRSAAAIAPRVDSATMLMLVAGSATERTDDAKAAGAAIVSGIPIVWTGPDGVPLETAAAILAQQPSEVVVRGVTPAVRDHLRSLGVSITTTLPVDHTRRSAVWVAAGAAPMDVAIASAAAAASGASLRVLLPEAASGQAALGQQLSSYGEVVVVGGTASVSDAAVAARG